MHTDDNQIMYTKNSMQNANKCFTKFAMQFYLTQQSNECTLHALCMHFACILHAFCMHLVDRFSAGIKKLKIKKNNKSENHIYTRN